MQTDQNRLVVNLDENVRGNLNLRLINILGAEVHRTQLNGGQLTHFVDLSATQSGVYILRLETADGDTYSKKFIRP